jgi:FMN-dependent oxidoreductase (nitrilotriacetate monooxygenase family)
MTDKLIRFNAFVMNTVGHQSPGLWRHPRDRSSHYTHIGYWLELAKLCERGRFDGIFIADVLGAYDVYRGAADAALHGGVQVPSNDPLLIVPAMAAATKHLGFGVTFSLSYEHPFPFARRMSTLDHLTNGRVGWNIVTGYLDSAARNLGLPKQTAHDERYDLAEEYLEVLYKLWEASWEEGAVRRDAAHGVFADPARVHAIAHRGAHFDVPGFHLSEPSPQRTPVLYQAGTSSRGRQFAGRHAECVFVSGPSKAVVAKSVRSIREALVEAGREPDEVLIYAQALIVTDATDAAAEAKLADFRRHIDREAALVLLSGWTGVDFSRYPLDATIEYIDTEAGRSALASFSAADPTRRWTVGEAAEFIGLGGRGPVIVGGPARVADELESWIDETGADGFNLAYAISPGSFEDVVEFIVPELQRRGRYRSEYSGGTLREKLFSRSAHLPESHPGRQVRIEAARRAAA